MKKIIPPKLKKWDEIRVIAPACSLSLISDENIKFALSWLENQWYNITFSKNCKEADEFMSSSIKSRIDDLNDAFRDPNVKMVLTVIGGFNSNQLLKYIDYNLIANNPKIFCWYSDITALGNAIFAKTWLITYSWPSFSTWAMQKEFEYNLEYWNKCIVDSNIFEIKSSPTWSDDAWYKNQENRNIQKNEWYKILNEWAGEWTIIGGNLCTLNLLQWTEFMPDISNSILFIEDDRESKAVNFDRDLQSLIHQPKFETVKWIVIGRFQKESEMTLDKMKYIIWTKKELTNIPVIINANFWHTNPIFTFPIGWTVRIGAKNNEAKIEIIEH